MKKLLAFTLCLALTLLAYACAASDTTISAPESSETSKSVMEQPGTSAPVTQMSSQPAFSDTVSKPTDPILPEEKETTLEKVLSFDIGMDGVFEYNFMFELDATEADVIVPGTVFSDGNGSFYHTDDVWIVCLNDGSRLPYYTYQADPISLGWGNNHFYVLYSDGYVRQFDISKGFGNAELVKETLISSEHAITPADKLVDNQGYEPLLQFHNGETYTLDMQPIEKEVLYILDPIRGAEQPAVTMNADGIYVIRQQEGAKYGFAVTEQGLRVSESRTRSETGTADQYIYTTYSPEGEIISRYMYQRGFISEKQPCEITFEYAGEVKTVTKYHARPMTVENHRFDTALYSRLWHEKDGTAYLLIYFPDHGEIYRITPGYSDVQFTTKEIVDK